MVREARTKELQALLELYLDLHDEPMAKKSAHLTRTWEDIMSDPHHHIIVNEVDGEIVSSCVCVIISNLTRGVRPYALVENLVTRSDMRGKGYAQACLEYAKLFAHEANCYKIMLLTSSQDEKTLQLYRDAGFNSDDKTGFVQWL
ncbi:MAG: GNAT family N-acetyltransferase [Atopobiaceae bacterium]|nr:GNAT family N-acetyltransferase [Atopobiaceae bacterium]